MASLPLTAAERLALLQRSWTAVAAGYAQAFVPRFAPWAADALQAYSAAAPPATGTIAVPACGPGQELVLLAAAFPRCRIVGLDLSAGMCQLAAELVQERGLQGQVEVRQADCSCLDGDLTELAGIVSVFGLQQMPEPAAVLANWARALRPGALRRAGGWACRRGPGRAGTPLPRHSVAPRQPPPPATPTPSPPQAACCRCASGPCAPRRRAPGS